MVCLDKFLSDDDKNPVKIALTYENWNNSGWFKNVCGEFVTSPELSQRTNCDKIATLCSGLS